MYYSALYQPRNKKKISAKAKHYIGKIIALQDAGQKEVAPGKNQVFYIASPNIGLVPNYDLNNLQSIPFIKWDSIQKANSNE